MATEESPSWRTATVSGAKVGTVAGVVSGVLSPLMGAVFDVAPLTMILQIAVGVALSTCGFGMLVGLTCGILTSLGMRAFWQVPSREMLLPVLSLVLAIAIARLFCTESVRAMTVAPWPVQTLFGAGNAFFVAVFSSLYAGLWIIRAKHLNRVRVAISDRPPHTTAACESAPGGSTKRSK